MIFASAGSEQSLEEPLSGGRIVLLKNIFEFTVLKANEKNAKEKVTERVRLV